MSDKTIEVAVELLYDGEENGKDANLYTDGDNKAWIPHSLIISSSHLGGRTYEIEIPEWLAVKKSLI